TNNSGIERINAIIFGLDTSTLIPYVLYVLKNVSNDNERNELFEFLETYIMRRMVAHANTKNYKQLFTDRLINNEILSKSKILDFLERQAYRVNILSYDEELENGFENTYLINKQSAGIIFQIESKNRNRQLQSTHLLKINKYSL